MVNLKFRVPPNPLGLGRRRRRAGTPMSPGFPIRSIGWIALIALLAGCAAKEQAAPAPAPQPRAAYSIDYALFEATGVHLGMLPADVLEVVDGICAANGYFGGKVEGGVTELVCTINGDGDGGRSIIRVGFAKPTIGHRAWRIYYRRKGPNSREAPLIREIIARYGPPRGEQWPLEMWWRDDRKNLRIIGEAGGLRVQLWDRSLNR